MPVIFRMPIVWLIHLSMYLTAPMYLKRPRKKYFGMAPPNFMNLT